MTEVRREVADDTRRHLTHIARGGALGLFGAGISATAGFVLVLIVTNLYPAHTAGLFFTVTSAFMLMAAIATLGTETGLGRFLLRYEAQGRRGDIPPTLRAAFRPTILYSVAIAIAVIVFAEPLSELIGLEGEEGATSLRVLAARPAPVHLEHAHPGRHPRLRPDAPDRDGRQDRAPCRATACWCSSSRSVRRDWSA